MSKARLDGVFEEAEAAARIRSNLLEIQMALSKGPKRTVERRRQSWMEIARDARDRAAALDLIPPAPKADELPILPAPQPSPSAT